MLKKLIRGSLIAILLVTPLAYAADIQPIEIKIKETTRLQKLVNDNKNAQQIAVLFTTFCLGMFVQKNKNNDDLINLSQAYIIGFVWPLFGMVIMLKGGDHPAITIVEGAGILAGAITSTCVGIKLFNKYRSKKNKNKQATEQKAIA